MRSLGAARFTADGVEPGAMDAVLDAAVLGAPALERVRDGGAFVAVRDGALPEPARGIRGENVRIRPDAAQPAELVRLVRPPAERAGSAVGQGEKTVGRLVGLPV